MTDEYRKAECYGGIAITQIQVGLAAEALVTTGKILLRTEALFSEIAEAMVNVREVPQFKFYLHLAGRDVRTATHACGQLARLYPSDAAAIAEVLVARQSSDER